MKFHHAHRLSAPSAFFFVLLLLLSSCSITKNLDKGEYLLRRNRVQVMAEAEKGNFTTDELVRYYRQKPNKRMFRVVAFHAAAYNFGESIHLSDSAGFSKVRKWGWKRKNRFRNWIMENGEAPVILDTMAVERTTTQLASFLFTRGHFSAQAEGQVTYRKKKAVVTYIVYPGEGHNIRNYRVDIPSEGIRKLYQEKENQSLIRNGMPYDEKVFQQERDRITRLLKDSGYYHFNKAYIVIEVDTFIDGNFADVFLKILDQSFYDEEVKDSLIVKPHVRSRIGRIFINPEYEGVFVQKDYQLIPVEIENRKTGQKSNYHFYASGAMDYKPHILIRNILLEPGQIYCLRDVERTYLHLSDLGNFSNISITFRDSPDPPAGHDTTVLWLDCSISMSRLSQQAYDVRMDVTNRAGDPGLSSYLVYQNRNLFRGAELMTLSLKGALEVQKILDKDQMAHTIINNLPFNTVELGADADFRIPKFVIPFRLAGLPKTFKPKTRLSAGVNFQERPDYKRYILKVTSGYEWQFRQNTTMAVNPFELNSVSIFPDPSFIEKINALNDERLKNSYSDHIITAITYSMIIDNQGGAARNRYSFIRINLESAGFVLDLFRDRLNYSVSEEGMAMIFNLPYAQYIRGDIDYRQFFRLRQKDHLFATRLYLGLGNPYSNMDVLPFEKSFYVGGANGIRAWPVRTIGPGSYHDENNLTRFDRTGDLGLEASIEYRFPIYSSFHGALFLDGGNVWLKNKNDKYPGGEIAMDRFLSEIAIGSGFGLRFVTFFVIRLDAGIKLRDPGKPSGERWMFDQIRLKNINWNFAIGYSI